MNSYLREVKNTVEADALAKSGSNSGLPKLVVIGNESGDLDSVVSTLTLALHLNNVETDSLIIPSEYRRAPLIVVPVINIDSAELKFKTEVTYWMEKNDIDMNNLIFRDEIYLGPLHAVDGLDKHFVLVDHHVAKDYEKVISILDHRPMSQTAKWLSSCHVDIRGVGSCATLVSEAIRRDFQEDDNLHNLDNELYKEVFQLLYGAIVLDTLNFNEEADLAHQLDVDNVQFIERFLKIENVTQHRRALYRALVTARADVSSLKPIDMLFKDLKIVKGINGVVAIAGVDVLKYINLETAGNDLKSFATIFEVDLFIFVGFVPNDDSFEKQLGFINTGDAELFDRVYDAVLTMKTPDLLLEKMDVDFLGGKFYRQKNLKASRKQILPVVQSVLNEM